MAEAERRPWPATVCGGASSATRLTSGAPPKRRDLSWRRRAKIPCAATGSGEKYTDPKHRNKRRVGGWVGGWEGGRVSGRGKGRSKGRNKKGGYSPIYLLLRKFAPKSKFKWCSTLERVPTLELPVRLLPKREHRFAGHQRINRRGGMVDPATNSKPIFSPWVIVEDTHQHIYTSHTRKKQVNTHADGRVKGTRVGQRMGRGGGRGSNNRRR